MTAGGPDGMRMMLLPLLLLAGLLAAGEERPAGLRRLLRVQLWLTALVLLSALADTGGPAGRRMALGAAALAAVAEAVLLARLLGDDRIPDAGPSAAARGRPILFFAGGILLTGWAFAAVHANATSLPSVADRRALAVSLSVLLAALVGLCRGGAAFAVLCRVASLANAVLLLATAAPFAPAAAILSAAALGPATLAASALLPRLAVAAATDATADRGSR